MKNVPDLRFFNFKEPWKLTTLGDVSESLSYGMNAAATEYDGVNKYIRITDIDEKTHRYNPENIVSPLGELSDEYLVGENDILFARTGASTGKTYLYSSDDGKLYYAGFLIKAHIKSNVDAKFVFYQTQREIYKNWVKVMSMRSGQPGINSSEYATFSFLIPSLKEQQKISAFFSLIDKKIEKQREKVEALQLYKKGMLQKVYSQKIRFKDDDGQEFPNWKYDTLGKFANKITKKNKNGKITNVISNSAKEGLIAQRDYFDKDIANIDNIDGYYVLEQGDFVYNPRKSTDAPYGPINKYLFKDKGVVSPLYLCFKVSKSIDSDFLAYYFKSDRWYRFIYENSDQGARHDRVSIKDSDFFKMTIPIPEIKEQQKIANFFRTLDKKIQSEQTKLNTLTEWKKGLLQKMFV
ncbi:type I restriction enzyme S subunit [Aeribacillus composti]|uniref:restriction endonuclease subunit S n=1 Tax=Aeribacillus composti TaxID=1868734 RepID=UPI001198F8CB|nr:restriction endonuclease subunit S [Aeribacillus composti]TVZ84341.1 type I restriction enzyme S subunit [Aeribacillus composti]